MVEAEISIFLGVPRISAYIPMCYVVYLSQSVSSQSIFVSLFAIVLLFVKYCEQFSLYRDCCLTFLLVTY